MNFSTLTARAFEERFKSRLPAGPAAAKSKKVRRETLNCWRPDSTPGPSDRRVLGTHIDPDSETMLGCAMTYAGILKHAVYEEGQPMRFLVGPARYSDRILERYCKELIKYALGKPGVDLISPSLVTYLLGGVPMKALEELAHRAVELMEFFPEPLGNTRTLGKSLAAVGFGAVPHVHNEDEPARRFAHFSNRQEYLINLRSGPSYARILIQDGAYGDSLRRVISGFKEEVIAEVEALLDPDGGEMTPLAAKGRWPIQVTDHMFERAVRRVFEKPWADLDLKGEPGDVHLDAEVLLARRLINRLTQRTLKKDKMSAVSLVGISLLTGISVANFTEFAVYDLRRRGETFITPEAIEEAVEMLEVHPHFICAQEMRGAATEIRYYPLEKSKWCQRVKAQGRPLWSTNGKFYLNGLDLNGAPTFKWKPFTVSSD